MKLNITVDAAVGQIPRHCPSFIDQVRVSRRSRAAPPSISIECDQGKRARRCYERRSLCNDFGRVLRVDHLAIQAEASSLSTISEGLEELGRQLFRGTLDQAAAQLRELAANRCFGLVTQDRLVWTIRQSA